LGDRGDRGFGNYRCEPGTVALPVVVEIAVAPQVFVVVLFVDVTTVTRRVSAFGHGYGTGGSITRIANARAAIIRLTMMNFTVSSPA
jgi:hypothetical protein